MLVTGQDLTLGLSGKVAIVTGAAGDIGRAAVALLAAHGMRVVAEDIRPSVQELDASDRVVSLIGDAADEKTAIRAVQLALERFGQLDVLVNNAGRTLNKPLLETTVEDWDLILAVNARGYFVHAREAVRAMLPSGGGSIVNVASIVSTVGLKTTSAYAASKGAIAQLTKVIALEYGEQGIRANAIGAGVIETNFMNGIVEDSRATLASYGSSHALGRVGQPEEIAQTIAWLASPRSSFVTGALIMADGGYTAM